ncbi:hypothetical protein N8J89_39805 [Crossiella sp. CA-258035]|uniref:hypothetical protein n=1 Tax=Crossiella sp. CA-258035 TaxID=2981138 RepID=UPI0024BC42E9|nr:hypothetical protein [Crossiella sp. CA-258035]WHT19170.1 hypothetical protein N8J89_39805 [Crossiella sp. CA-258035]
MSRRWLAPALAVLGALLAPAAGADPLNWQAVPVPVTKGDLTAVAALSDTQAYAVGYRLRSDTAADMLALRWDGRTWTQHSTLPAESFPQALAVRSATDMWAAGAGTAQWNGSSWVRRALASDPGGTVTPEALALAEHNAVWVAGKAVPGAIKNGTPAVQRWDGTAWRRQTLPALGKGELNGIVSLGAGQALAVGAQFGTAGQPQRPLVLRLSNGQWRTEPVPQPAGHSWLSAVTSVSPTEAWAVGATSVNGVEQPLALRWNGSAWAATQVPPVPDGRLRAVGRTAAGELLAAGGKGAVAVLLRWDPAANAWQRLADPGIVARTFSTVPGSNAVWAVGISRQGDLVPQTRHTVR